MRASIAEVITGWRTGRVTSSPRKPRIQATPSPRTTWSASIRSASRGWLATWPPTTIVAQGWCWRTSLHIFSTLPRLGRIALMPTTS